MSRTTFEHANALVSMWDAFDRSAPDQYGCRLAKGEPATIAFIESIAVVMAMSRIAESKLGISMDAEP